MRLAIDWSGPLTVPPPEPRSCVCGTGHEVELYLQRLAAHREQVALHNATHPGCESLRLAPWPEMSWAQREAGGPPQAGQWRTRPAQPPAQPPEVRPGPAERQETAQRVAATVDRALGATP